MTHVDPRVAGLRAAVENVPDDVALRLHLAELLVAAGERDEAVRHAAAVLQRDPANAAAIALIAGGTAAAAPPASSVIGDREETSRRLDAEFAGVVPPMFVEAEEPGAAGYDAESTGLRLRDVAGMTQVKERLEAAFLAPLRNPELTRLYGKSLRGGLLVYGPPGCGKTFIARAGRRDPNVRPGRRWPGRRR